VASAKRTFQRSFTGCFRGIAALTLAPGAPDD
jgi:hypothetical protein